MKKPTVLCLIALLWIIPHAAADTHTAYTADSGYYQITSYVNEEHAREMAVELSTLFDFYNSYFHFDPSVLPHALQVKIFATRQEYDDYISRFIDDPREDFVYLHYSDPQRSELVGVADDTRENRMALSHQGFIQFLRSFIPNPPLWMREGFAVYFENLRYEPEFDSISYRENLSWLETLKSELDNGLFDELSPEQLLHIDVETAQEHLENFYPRAWGLVSFLLHSPVREYNRLLWDSISALDPNNSLNENNQSVIEQAFEWIDPAVFTEDLYFYIETRQTFRGLVQDGIQLYAEDSHGRAEQRFIQALNLQDGNYIPYYYLGLINYSRGNYALADFYYTTALELGADEPVTLYALGVNAYADDRFDEAVELLMEARAIAPEEYQEKADQLITRIQEEV
ncbi:MAG: tetratricopeptide repeat protein [Spirochaeta sp.]